RHLGKACIYSVFGQPNPSTRFLSQDRIGGQSSRNQFIIAVDSRCNSVHVANEGSDPTTDHSQSDARRLAVSHDMPSSDRRPSILRFASLFVPEPAKSSKARSVTRMM